MYLWNINKILDGIRNDTFSESDKLKYYIITSLISLSVAFESFDFMSNSGIIKIVLMISTTIIGIIYVYNKNKYYDGKNFIERTTIFAVPLFCRIMLFSIPLAFIVILSAAYFGYSHIQDSPYSQIIFTLILVIISIYWEGHWFSRLSENDLKDIEISTEGAIQSSSAETPGE